MLLASARYFASVMAFLWQGPIQSQGLQRAVERLPANLDEPPGTLDPQGLVAQGIERPPPKR
jgi:hypothetical protein